MIDADSSDLIESTVTSTRIRLARNLSSYPFPDKLEAAQAKEIIRTVGYELNRLDMFSEYELGKIDPDEATYLLEKHLISPDLIRRKNISAAFISSDGEVSVMINEEDHLREQYILKGCNLYKAYERISGIDDGIGSSVSFAYDERLGYLTACPSNLGTGMRASVMMFLPGLAKYKKLEGLLPSLKANGLTVRGVFGEGTAAEGYSYQISNERTLGVSESDILAHMNEVALNFAELEARARERMLEEDALGYRDMCLRAYGTLTNCAVLTLKELMTGMVKVKLGVALGFFKATDMDALNDFWDNMRPVSFKRGNCPEAKDERECDILRAEIVHKILPELVCRTKKSSIESPTENRKRRVEGRPSQTERSAITDSTENS